MPDTNLFELELAAQLNLLPALTKLVEAVATQYQFPLEQSIGLAEALGQAVKNAIEHGFEGRPGTVRVQVIDQGDRLQLKVRDQGLPFDPQLLLSTGRGGVGHRSMHQFSDQVTVQSLGPEGMEVSIVKFLPPVREMAVEHLVEPPQETGPVTYRLLEPGDSVALTRCAYRTYGYSYAPEVYYPEMLAQGFEYGYLIMMGCFDAKGELIGSLAVIKDDPEAAVGELGIGMTDPRYRGRGIFEHLLTPILEEARRSGMQGLFAETVTVHTITQKSKHKKGWRETGAVLGYIGHREFKAIPGSAPEQRQTIVLFYQNFAPGPDVAIYLPLTHREILQKIMDANGLIRRVEQPAASELPTEGQLEVTLRAQDGTARLFVTSWGQNTLAQIEAQRKSLCLDHVDLIMLDLPLDHPASALSCQEIEQTGFFFAGLVPGLNEGKDILRLQYLNNVSIDPSLIQTYSEFARELLGYVFACAKIRG